MLLKFYRPVANAMNVDQACSRCYKSFTGLYLQVCKYRAIFKITFSHEIRQFRYANACSHFLTQNYLADKRKHNELRG